MLDMTVCDSGYDLSLFWIRYSVMLDLLLDRVFCGVGLDLL